MNPTNYQWSPFLSYCWSQGAKKKQPKTNKSDQTPPKLRNQSKKTALLKLFWSNKVLTADYLCEDLPNCSFSLPASVKIWKYRIYANILLPQFGVEDLCKPLFADGQARNCPIPWGTNLQQEKVNSAVYCNFKLPVYKITDIT